MMDQLTKLLDRFLYRDFFYVLAGLIIVLALLDAVVDISSVAVDPGFLLGSIFVGSSFVIGLLNQEIWSQTPWIGTSSGSDYGTFMKGVFRRHEGREWQDGRNPSGRIESKRPGHYQRAVDLKQVGSSIGTAFLTCSLIYVASPLFGVPAFSAIMAALAMIALAIPLLIMSRLHGMRQTDANLNGLNSGPD